MAIKHEIVSVPFRGFYISNKNEVILRSDSSRKFPSPFGVSIFPIKTSDKLVDFAVSVPFRGFYISNVPQKMPIGHRKEFPSPFGVSIFPI